ncbi:tRNA dihydrouridine synthase DusB [Bacillota bacterium LX-D]|nr:tRNA dihydrouridine synthase DusB [Bacillota bacterium LX-D]
MQIGALKVQPNVISAPIAGVSDKAFRLLAKEHGCHLVFTEMISDKALLFNNPKTYQLLDLEGEKYPIAVQIFGSEPEIMAKAAQIVARSGAAIIDINMGCPTPKIVRNGEGAALMRKPELAFQIVESVVKSVDIPVTVKIRKGWNDQEQNAVVFAQGLEAAGAQCITIHGRTRDQLYSGKADWDIISQVVQAVKIPVIGNGDIFEPLDAQEMMKKTNCAGVMIARGSFGNPWLFSRTIAFLDGKLLPEPSWEERITTAIRHLELVVAFKGEAIGVKEMRKHIAWYVKGGPNAARIREKINRLDEFSSVKKFLQNILE